MVLEYAYMNSPIGNIALAITQDGLIRLAIQKKEEDFLNEMNSKGYLYIKEEKKNLFPIIEQLDLYFQNKLKEFNVKINWNILADFQRIILKTMMKIKYGTTLSYRQLAALAGFPNHSRAVGQVCKNNPIPIIIPCHRVIYSNGRIGNYSPDAKIKHYLLTLENAVSAQSSQSSII